MPIGSTDFGMGITFVLEDAFTKVATKISNSFQGMKGSFNKGAAAINNGINKVRDNFGTLAVAGATAFALVAPFGIAVQKSAELSDALADVTKTTGISGSALQQLRGDLESIDTRTSIEGLLEIAKAGGSMGVAQKDIASFTDSVDKLNVALGDQFAGPEELARGVAQLSNNLKDIQTGDIATDLLKVGNVLNFMGANAKATESTIFGITQRMAGLQASAGLSSEQLFGISTAMAETGLSTEVLGSNMTVMFGKMLSDTDKFAKAIGVNKDAFRDLANKDSLAAMELFAEKIKEQNPLQADFNEKLKNVGLSGARMSNVFNAFANNLDNVRNRINQAGDALTNTDSIMDEFNAKNTTLAAVLEKAQNRFSQLQQKIGDALAPAVLVVAAGIEKLLKFVNRLSQTFVGKLLIGAAAVAAGLTALVVVGSALIPIFTSMGITAAGALAVITSPITLIVAGILAIGLAFENLKSKFDVFADSNIMQRNMGKGVELLFLKIGGLISAVVEIFKTATSEGFSMTSKMASALQEIGILDFVLALGTWIVRIKEFFRGVMDVAVILWDSFKNVFGAIFDAVGEVVDSLGLFEGGMDKAGGSMDLWRAAGQGVALFLQGTLIPLFEVFAFAIRFVGKIIATVFSLFDGKIGTTTALLKSFIELFTSTFERFQNIGSSFSEGIGSLFGFGDDEGDVGLAEDGTGAASGVSSIGQAQAKSKASVATQKPTVLNNKTKEVKDVHLTIDLGPEKITKSVNAHNDFEDSRD